MSRNLRIIHCLRAPVGGLFRHVVDLAVEQAKVGHEVGVIYDQSTESPAAQAQLALLRQVCKLGVRATPMPRLVNYTDYTAYRAVKKFAAESDAQILHGHGAKGGAYARLAASALRGKRGGGRQTCLSFYTPHGGSLHYSPSSLIGRVFLGIERKLASQTSGLIFESAYSARIYGEVIGSHYCQVRIIPNGLQPDEFVVAAPSSAHDVADFLFIGELRQLKGVDVLLKAMAALSGEFPKLRLAVVGDGPDEAQFKALCTELHLDGRVQFFGRLPAREAFGLGRCLVVPSRAESFPYIVLEAGAARLPMISTDVGGIHEITEGSAMKLIAADDVLALANEMRDCLMHPQERAETAAQLQALIQQKFTVETMSSRITEFYLTILKR